MSHSHKKIAMKKDDKIIATKMNIPRIAPDCISRPRLYESLNQGLKRKLTLVSAPAGYGKTTLVAQWLMRRDRPFGWLSLDEMDSDPKRYLLHLISAIHQMHPDFGKSLEELLQFPMTKCRMQKIISTLINDIESYSEETVLIVDDYHLIQSKTIHHGMDYIIKFLPENVHIYIISRNTPDLSLSLLRASCNLGEIRVSDLKFTKEEVRLLVHETMRILFSEKNLAMVTEKTEGWIAGLRMVLMMITDGNDDIDHLIKHLTGATSYISEYLEKEAFAVQTDKTRDFLLKTAILRRMTPDLCNAVTGSNDAFYQLSELKRDNLFIHALDSKCKWFRYHRLFAEQLKMRLKMTQPGIIKELHLKASNWLYENEFTEDAIWHTSCANQYRTQSNSLVYANIRLAKIFSSQNDCEPVPVSADQSLLPLSYQMDPLSKRELEVLKAIEQGLTNQQIADKLFVSLNTIRTHTRNIHSKLDVNTRTKAVNKARQAGIL